MKKNVCFVIDSMSTISNDMFNNEDIYVLNYCVNDKNNNLIYDDFSPKQKEKIIGEIESKQNVYKTSFLNNQIIEEKFDSILQKFKKIVYLCAASGYTGQFESCKNLMDLPKYKNKVFVINSYAIASTIETLLNVLIEKIKLNPELNYDDINTIAKDVSKRSIILFSPKNLDGMVNSGRVPLLLTKIMKLTKVHPVIKCEEKNKPTGIFFRKWPEGIEKLCEGILKIFKNNINKDNIHKIYFYSSLLSKEEIDNYVLKIANFLNIDKNIVLIRDTPLPILIYTLKDSIGIGISLNENNYKI